ncbi:MAG: D-amino acid dehydrogenase [Alphaproteobacteria bacterium]|nr:D-amino acid dehydrogenase [Alphaproteobacteria bacterium]
MDIIVLGGGVIGVSTAWYLARAGHKVTVVERQAGAGLETSFANAGEISPGYSAPWAAPGLPVKAIKWLFMMHRPLVIRPRLDPAMVVWGLRLLGNCTASRYRLNKGRMLRLAHYSRDCLEELRAETGITYDQRMQGTLQLFRTEKQLAGAEADIAILKDFGVRHELLDRDGCIRAEPALARVRGKIAGGLRLPDDETGDCFMFTQSLAAKAEALGVKFLFGTTIQKIHRDGGGITGVQVMKEGAEETLRANAYVMALGSYSPLALKPLGISLPVYPVKGYSLTLPIADAGGAPESTVMDETYKVAVTRLGSRVRVGGTAELAGYDLSLHEPRRKTLEHVVSDLFPAACDLAKGKFWAGLRPMTPDGPPIIGASSIANLFLNTGHGTLGWTMAAGSGQALADLISGKAPAVDLSDLGPRC